MSENNEVVPEEVVAVDAAEAGPTEVVGDDWKTVQLDTRHGLNWLGAKSYKDGYFGRLTWKELAEMDPMGRRSKNGAEYFIDCIVFGHRAVEEGQRCRPMTAYFVAVHIDGAGWRVYNSDEFLASAVAYIGEMGYPTLDRPHNVYLGHVRQGGPTLMRPAVMGPAAS